MNLKRALMEEEFYLLFESIYNKEQLNLLELFKKNGIKIKDSSLVIVKTDCPIEGQSENQELVYYFDTCVARVEFYNKLPKREDNVITCFPGFRHGKKFSTLMNLFTYADANILRYDEKGINTGKTFAYIKNIFNEKEGKNVKFNKIILPTRYFNNFTINTAVEEFELKE
jgi:hypothetical protein